MFRPQDHHRTSFNRLARSQLKIVFSEQMAQDHEDLQHRVISTDTAAGAGTEGKEGAGRAELVVRSGEALRIEIFGILPVAQSVMRTVHMHSYGRGGGNNKCAYAVVRDSRAVHHPKR